MISILYKNTLLDNKIKKTNQIYKHFILSINKNNYKLIDTIHSLLKYDDEIIKIISINKFKYYKTDCYKYIFIMNHVYSQEFLNNKIIKFNVGKWLLFASLDYLLYSWKIIRYYTFINELGFSAKFIGNEKKRVIYIYFNNYHDKETIMNFGYKIKKLINYNHTMYFKTNKMTRNKIYGPGSWIYKLNKEPYEFI